MQKSERVDEDYTEWVDGHCSTVDEGHHGRSTLIAGTRVPNSRISWQH